MEQRAWLLRCAVELWRGFEQKFLALWAQHAQQGGAYSAALFGPEAPAGPAALAEAQRAFMAGVWGDAVGFMGAVIIRRIVGIAHVADLDSIADADVRAVCERRALGLGRALLVGGGGGFASVADVAAAAVAAREDGQVPVW